MDLYPTRGLFCKVITRSLPESPLWGEVNQLWRWWQCPLISPDPFEKTISNDPWKWRDPILNQAQSGSPGRPLILAKGWERDGEEFHANNGTPLLRMGQACLSRQLYVQSTSWWSICYAKIIKNRPHCSPQKIQTVESYWNSDKLNLVIFIYKETFGVIKRGLENPLFSSRISQPQSLDKARQLYPIPVWFTKKLGQIPVLPSGKLT